MVTSLAIIFIDVEIRIASAIPISTSMKMYIIVFQNTHCNTSPENQRLTILMDYANFIKIISFKMS